jgi:electron transport complex protein RnfD
MPEAPKFVVSHAPFWHSGSSIAERTRHILYAALPAAIVGALYWGAPAFGVLALAVSTAMLWELAFNFVSKEPIRIGDGHAALIGLLFAMLLPATTPWWAVVVGTFIAIVIGKQIYGGNGAYPFNPVALAFAIMMLSWSDLFDFNTMLRHYDKAFPMAYPLAALKYLGVEGIADFQFSDLLMGRQAAGIGAGFGLGLIAGGGYLIYRGFIRWEICLSFLGTIFITAVIFNLADPARYAGPWFHLFTGYTLIGAFFLATEDSTSPVHFWPMLVYGAIGGFMTVLIRNIGVYVDGVIFAILLGNLFNPMVDKIRPKAIGKVESHA